MRAAFAKTVIDAKQNISYRRIEPSSGEVCAGLDTTKREALGAVGFGLRPCDVRPMVAVYARTLVVGTLRIHHTHSLCALHFIRFILGEE